MNTPVIPDAELDDDDILLTDAEREGMKDDDGEAAAGTGTEDKGAAGTEPAKAEGDDATTAGTEGADEKGDDEPNDDFKPTSVPPLRTGDTAQAKTRLTEIDAESERLARDFDDGEMTATEYREANAKLEQERRDLDWTLRKAELSQEMAAQAAEAAWFSTVGEFLNEHKDVLKPNSLVLQAFDIAVRQVTGDSANNALNDRQKLQKAYDALRADMGLPPLGKAPAPKPASSRPVTRDLPPNLKNVPAADLETTDNGTFAVLDRLLETDPLAYEERLSKMSEADVEAYLRSR